MAKNHPQAAFASQAQVVSWYEVLLAGAIETAATGNIIPLHDALTHINPNNWVETVVQDHPYHEVAPGDTLAAIALKYGKSLPEDVQELVKLNRQIFLYSPYHLLVGDNVLIPKSWIKS